MAEFFNRTMDVYLDVTGPSFPARFLGVNRTNSGGAAPTFYQGDFLKLRVWLCVPAVELGKGARTLANDGAVILCIKARRDCAAPALTVADDFELVEDEEGVRYEGFLNTATAGCLAVQFSSSGRAAVFCDIVLQGVAEEDDSVPERTFSFDSSIVRQVYGGGDDSPSGPPPASYPPPSQLVTKAQVSALVQSAVEAVGALTKVEHDETLSGDGTADSKLHVEVGAGAGEGGSAPPAGYPPADQVATKGEVAELVQDALAAAGALTKVEHDETLSGDGTADSKLHVEVGAGGGGLVFPKMAVQSFSGADFYVAGDFSFIGKGSYLESYSEQDSQLSGGTVLSSQFEYYEKRTKFSTTITSANNICKYLILRRFGADSCGYTQTFPKIQADGVWTAGFSAIGDWSVVNEGSLLSAYTHDHQLVASEILVTSCAYDSYTNQTIFNCYVPQRRGAVLS